MGVGPLPPPVLSGGSRRAVVRGFGRGHRRSSRHGHRRLRARLSAVGARASAAQDAVFDLVPRVSLHFFAFFDESASSPSTLTVLVEFPATGAFDSKPDVTESSLESTKLTISE